MNNFISWWGEYYSDSKLTDHHCLILLFYSCGIPLALETDHTKEEYKIMILSLDFYNNDTRIMISSGVERWSTIQQKCIYIHLHLSLAGMNIFVAFFLLLLLLTENTPPAASSIPLIGNWGYEESRGGNPTKIKFSCSHSYQFCLRMTRYSRNLIFLHSLCQDYGLVPSLFFLSCLT